MYQRFVILAALPLFGCTTGSELAFSTATDRGIAAAGPQSGTQAMLAAPQANTQNSSQNSSVNRAEAAPTATMAIATEVEPQVEAVDLQEFNQVTVCQNITRPGSRIVVERRCMVRDSDPALDAMRQEMIARQVEDLRREQEHWERAMRERTEQMQRAAMEAAMRDQARQR